MKLLTIAILLFAVTANAQLSSPTATATPLPSVCHTHFVTADLTTSQYWDKANNGLHIHDLTQINKAYQVTVPTLSVTLEPGCQYEVEFQADMQSGVSTQTHSTEQQFGTWTGRITGSRGSIWVRPVLDNTPIGGFKILYEKIRNTALTGFKHESSGVEDTIRISPSRSWVIQTKAGAPNVLTVPLLFYQYPGALLGDQATDSSLWLWEAHVVARPMQ